MKFLNKLFGEKHEEPTSATKVTTITDREKAQRAIELAEKYINMEHPVSPMERMLGIEATKPIYKVQSNQVVRGSSIGVDMKITSVATCLPKKNLTAGDQRQIAKMAFDAIYHYASLSKVYAFFSVPFFLKQKIWVEGTPLPPEEQCRLLAGVENLLLEIYEELPQGGTITDAVVERKIDQLIASIQVQDSQSTPPPKDEPAAPVQAENAERSLDRASMGEKNLPVAPVPQEAVAKSGLGVQQCPSCTQNVPPVTLAGKQYCSNCGVPWSKDEASQSSTIEILTGQSVNCPSCTNAISPLRIGEYVYCPECGVRLSLDLF